MTYNVCVRVYKKSLDLHGRVILFALFARMWGRESGVHLVWGSDCAHFIHLAQARCFPYKLYGCGLEHLWTYFGC